MLDINFIRENIEVVKKAVRDKGVEVNIDELLEVDKKRRGLQIKVDELRQQRNITAKERDIEKGRKIKEDLEVLEEDLKKIQEKFQNLMVYVPNIPSEDSPVGPNADSNEEVSKWGDSTVWF